jgi:hypothetical protein
MRCAAVMVTVPLESSTGHMLLEVGRVPASYTSSLGAHLSILLTLKCHSSQCLRTGIASLAEELLCSMTVQGKMHCRVRV